MLRCSPEAFAKCPTRALCGNVHEATFTEDSECARFNRSVMDKPLTNADRIRAMNDEELAAWLLEIMMHHVACFGEGAFGYTPCRNPECDCVKCGVVWLQQPAKEVPHE